MSSSECYDVNEPGKYELAAFDKFDLEEDQITESYDSLVDQNVKLHSDNAEYSKLTSGLRSKLSCCESKCSSQEEIIRSLQRQLRVQQTAFDKKFNDFLVCAQDYDRQKSGEIASLKTERTRLTQQYDTLYQRYHVLQDKLIRSGAINCKTWNWCDIYEWIVTLNDARLHKYQDVLFSNLKTQEINGATLGSLNDDDLYYLGVKDHSDRQVLAEYITKLVGTYHPHHQSHHFPAHGLQHGNNRNYQSSFHQQQLHSRLGAGYAGHMQHGSPASSATTPMSGAHGSPVVNPMLTEHLHKSLRTEQLKQIRIRQPNIVYVVGLPVSMCNAKLLKSDKWFGKFGCISRICFNTSPKCVKANSIPTFVTYTNEFDAEQAIHKMNLFCLSDGTRLKTNYGRTKYCPAFSEGMSCLNHKCKFLHQFAKYEDIITEQEINDFNAIRAGPPSRFNNHK